MDYNENASIIVDKVYVKGCRSVNYACRGRGFQDIKEQEIMRQEKGGTERWKYR